MHLIFIFYLIFQIVNSSVTFKVRNSFICIFVCCIFAIILDKVFVSILEMIFQHVSISDRFDDAAVVKFIWHLSDSFCCDISSTEAYWSIKRYDIYTEILHSVFKNIKNKKVIIKVLVAHSKKNRKKIGSRKISIHWVKSGRTDLWWKKIYIIKVPKRSGKFFFSHVASFPLNFLQRNKTYFWKKSMQIKKSKLLSYYIIFWTMVKWGGLWILLGWGEQRCWKQFVKFRLWFLINFRLE